MRNKKDPQVRKIREASVLKAKYEESLKAVEKQYKCWWNSLVKDTK